jgi:alkaline phosphatase D
VRVGAQHLVVAEARVSAGVDRRDPAAFAAGLQALIGPLVYCDTSRRGFMVLTCTAQEARADWHFVETVLAPVAGTTLGRSLRVLPGSAGRQLIEVANAKAMA